MSSLEFCQSSWDDNEIEISAVERGTEGSDSASTPERSVKITGSHLYWELW